MCSENGAARLFVAVALLGPHGEASESVEEDQHLKVGADGRRGERMGGETGLLVLKSRAEQPTACGRHAWLDLYLVEPKRVAANSCAEQVSSSRSTWKYGRRFCKEHE